MNGSNQPRSWLPWMAMLVVGGTFFLNEHDFDTSLKDSFTQTAEEMEETAAGGDTVRRLTYPMLGLFGLGLLFTTPRSEQRIDPFLLLPMIGFLVWCGMTVVWSHAPGMTIRRLVILYCVVAASAGLARHIRTRDLLVMGVAVPTLLLTIGFLAELRLGTFRPWNSEHRFSGTLHPNTQGINLACLCLSAACLLKRQTGDPRTGGLGSSGQSPGARFLLISAFLYGFLFLLLTKSRTSAAGVLVALAAYWTVTTPLRTKLLLGLAGTWAVASLVFGVLLVGIDVEKKVAGAALMGREEQAESLTGRLPIWTTLAPFVASRPIAGYGYDSFWIPDHIAEVSAELHWGIREAHSTFIDAILSVGLVGMLLALSAVLMGMLRCQQRYGVSRDPVHGLLLGMFVFGLINACTESAMLVPGYYTFIAGTGLWLMAMRPPTPTPIAASQRDGVEHGTNVVPRGTPQLAAVRTEPAPEYSDASAPHAPAAWPRGCSPQSDPPTHTML